MADRNPFNVPTPRMGGQQRREAKQKLRDQLMERLLEQELKRIDEQMWTDEERRRTHKDPNTGVYVGPESKRHPHGKGI